MRGTIVPIRFGSNGRSWFYVREVKGERLRGYRYSKSAWGNLQTIDTSKLTKREPRIAKPALPSPEQLAAFDEREAKLRAQAKDRLAAASAIPIGARVSWRGKTWQASSGSYQPVDLTGTVVGRTGQRLEVARDDGSWSHWLRPDEVGDFKVIEG